MKHLLFSAISDSLLLLAVAGNLYLTFKAARHLRLIKKTRVEMEQFNRDKFPMMVSALERLATAVCPLCAIAAGESRAEDMEGEPLDCDTESGGQHTIYVRGGQAITPCRAASIRADARTLFSEAFQDETMLTTMVGATTAGVKCPDDDGGRS